MVVARNGSESIDLGDSKIAMGYGRTNLVRDMEVTVSQFDSANEYILTDDHSPVEYLMLR